MSCFIVDDQTVLEIVNYVNYEVYQGAGDKTLLNEVTQSLVDHNYISVNARYSENNLPHTLKFKKIEKKDLNIFQVEQSCNCWNYQSCEYPNYENSIPWKIVENILKHVKRECGMNPDLKPEKIEWR